MAFPTAVNDQITDAVTQSNVKVVAESPAMAISSLYQSLAHSTGILFENAVAAQQQMNTLAQAATNQGVMQIYSVDTAAAAGATEKVAQTGVADNLASLLTVLNAFRGERGAAPERAHAGTASADVATAGHDAPRQDAYAGLADAVKDAVRFSNDTVLDSADTFNAALRQCTDSFVHALREVQRAESEALRRVLVDAALVAIVKALLQDSGRIQETEASLRAILHME